MTDRIVIRRVDDPRATVAVPPSYSIDFGGGSPGQLWLNAEQFDAIGRAINSLRENREIRLIEVNLMPRVTTGDLVSKGARQ